MKVSELISSLQKLPQDAEVEATVRLVLEDLSRPMTGAERAREFRRRQRENVTRSNAVSLLGGRGEICEGTEKQAEKKEETGSTYQVDLGPSVTKRNDETLRATESVFDAWRRETGHNGSRLDRKRQKRIEARLREGFTPEDLIAAITNHRNDPFLMGKNDTGRVYDGIETLLRDAAQVERLRALTTPLVGNNQGNARTRPAQPSHGVTGFEKAVFVR